MFLFCFSGWTMQMSRFLYLSRRWILDEPRIRRMLQLLATTSKPFQLVLFPEGTNLSPQTKKRSDQFAEKNNLAKYEHVLHPRTTGFAFMVQQMRESE